MSQTFVWLIWYRQSRTHTKPNYVRPLVWRLLTFTGSAMWQIITFLILNIFNPNLQVKHLRDHTLSPSNTSHTSCSLTLDQHSQFKATWNHGLRAFLQYEQWVWKLALTFDLPVKKCKKYFRKYRNIHTFSYVVHTLQPVSILSTQYHWVPIWNQCFYFFSISNLYTLE